MKRQLNYDLLLFHVREACEELDALLLRIKKMLGELEEPLSEADKAILEIYDRPLEESGLAVLLEHAYHHHLLNIFQRFFHTPAKWEKKNCYSDSKMI